MKKLFLIFIFSMPLFSLANTFTVTTTNDSGNGSLRNALQSAFYLPGPHSIVFNIPTSDAAYNASEGTWIIRPQSSYNYISKDHVTIDGFTQTQNQGNTNPLGPEIIIDGSQYGMNVCFSAINASHLQISGFNIRGFIYGIQVNGNFSDHCRIFGNYIGTNAQGTDTLGNYIGIEVIGGADSAIIGGTAFHERNLVSGNRHIGIRLLDVQHCKVINNYVGVDRTGTLALPNYDGISLESAVKHCIIGGSTSSERNLVSGNVAYGIPIFGSGAEHNKVIGNYIGTDSSGTQAIPNTYGVLFDDGAHYNWIGGLNPGEKNILSGNSAYGVFIYNFGTHSNTVYGNYIGTDMSGTSPLPNANGIVIDGAAYKNIIDSNVISANTQHGIQINITGCDSNRIVRNKIGVDAQSNPMGNIWDGIRISQGARHSIIGGSPAESNIIAWNGNNGINILFTNDDYHLISCNSFYNNGLLAIDLYPGGVTANDANDGDLGPNDNMNFPVIDSIVYTLIFETYIYGHLVTASPEHCEVQIYKAQPDSMGHGEGETYLTSVTPGANGYWSATLFNVSNNDFITTIAIDSSNNTSEFSVARTADQFADVENIEKADDIIVYPNPNKGSFKITGDNIERISIFSADGKLIKSLSIKTYKINLVQSGLYILKIEKDGSVEYRKVLITF